jgi:hypothetical protein
MATNERLKEAIGELPRLEATMATKGDLKEAIGGLERTLSAQIGELASQIATLTKRRKN